MAEDKTPHRFHECDVIAANDMEERKKQILRVVEEDLEDNNVV